MKNRKILVFFTLALTLVLSIAALSSCGETAQPQKLADIEDITKGYFGENNSSVTIPLSDYVNANGCNVTYYITSSDSSVATATAENGVLTATLLKGEGSSDITVSVQSDGKEAFTLSFKITAKTYTKIACIGDSLTYGHSWTEEAYPVYLKQFLGSSYDVGNFGLNGASITGTNPSLYIKYAEKQQYTDSIAFDADVVIIMLGTNDSKDWKAASPNFEDWYKELIASYQEKNPDVEIILVTAPPTLENNKFSIPNDVIRDQVCPVQRDVAEELELPLIDFRKVMEEYEGGYLSLIRGDAAFDGVHLSVEGAQLLARLLMEEIYKL